MKISINQSHKGSNDGEKSKSWHEAPTHAGSQNRGQPAYKKGIVGLLSESTQNLKMKQHFHSAEVPHR